MRQSVLAPCQPSVFGRGAIGTSLVLVIPLFVVYELGVLLFPYGRDRSDFVTRMMWRAVDCDHAAFVLLNLAIAGAFSFLALRLRDEVGFRRFVPMLAEAVLIAAPLVALVVVTTPPPSEEFFDLPLSWSVLVAAGSGLFEELVFRLALLVGGTSLLRAMGLRHAAAVGFAVLGSSILFGLSDTMIGFGDHELQNFAVRFAGGIVLGMVAYLRSFAHAVYAHALTELALLLIYF